MDEEEIEAWLRMKPTVTYLSAEEWGRFVQALEGPPKTNEALRRLMSAPSIFETET